MNVDTSWEASSRASRTLPEIDNSLQLNPLLPIKPAILVSACPETTAPKERISICLTFTIPSFNVAEPPASSIRPARLIESMLSPEVGGPNQRDEEPIRAAHFEGRPLRGSVG